nr:DUF4390 domain-containing protein [Chitinasiproducens palmae]
MLLRYLAALLLWSTLLGPVPAIAETIAVQRVSLESDGSAGWNLDAQFDFSLSPGLAEALHKGISLYFTTDFTLTRPRWYWFNQEASSASRTFRLSYEPLTRQYSIGVGGLRLPCATLAEALGVIRHVTAWHVIDRDMVKPGESYTAAVRMRLDTALMPKPFQIDAVNNRDWSLASDWLQFNFTPPEHAK